MYGKGFTHFGVTQNCWWGNGFMRMCGVWALRILHILSNKCIINYLPNALSGWFGPPRSALSTFFYGMDECYRNSSPVCIYDAYMRVSDQFVQYKILNDVSVLRLLFDCWNYIVLPSWDLFRRAFVQPDIEHRTIISCFTAPQYNIDMDIQTPNVRHTQIQNTHTQRCTKIYHIHVTQHQPSPIRS